MVNQQYELVTKILKLDFDKCLNREIKTTKIEK